MRLRGIEVAGIVAAVGLLVLLVLAFLPSRSDPVVTTGGGGDSILEPATPSATPGDTASPSAEPTATPEESASPEPATIPPERRARLAVQVLNAGAPDGAAALATGALAEQSFNPREPTDAVAESAGTRVLYAENRRRAGATVGRIVGADRGQVVPADPNDPNWATFGDGLDVLVIIGPPLP